MSFVRSFLQFRTLSWSGSGAYPRKSGNEAGMLSGLSIRHIAMHVVTHLFTFSDINSPACLWEVGGNRKNPEGTGKWKIEVLRSLEL